MTQSPFADLLSCIERDLSSVYGFVPPVRANQHLLRFYEGPERAAVVFEQDPENQEVFIGIYFDHAITSRIQEANPLEQLSNQNLDAFAAVVEEVSHFHLILQRAKDNLEATQLELEWQAEIDKFLLATRWMHQQQNHAHVHHLSRKIFDEAQVPSGRYSEANHYAARFCNDLVRRFSLDVGKAIMPRAMQDMLRKIYRAGWQEKLQICESLRLKSAA